jgi:hypothetical protein
VRSHPLIPASTVAVATVSLLIAGCGGDSRTTAAATAQSGPAALSHCMRSHGVPGFPDPTRSGQISKSEVVALAGSPQFKAAQTACEHLLHNGSFGQQETPQQVRARSVAALAFARCIRGHGFPNFPDPTTDGQLTHEMLANAGINLHQPAIVQAADACVGVTHGLITRANVARFVAEQ